MRRHLVVAFAIFGFDIEATTSFLSASPSPLRHARSSFSTRGSRTLDTNTRSLVPLLYVPSEQSLPFSSSVETASWTMEQDWALMDQLPKFTVGQDDPSHIRTFWTQLAACTPILSEKYPDELLQRCRELQSTNHTCTQRPITYGPSPELLQNWQIDLDHRDGKAVGQTKDGRTIWLRYHTVGRLEGDPFSDVYSSSVFSLIPGGYLEAVGGRIYELGEPREQQLWEKNKNNEENKVSDGTTNNQDHDRPLDWWIPPTTATVSALLASTLLSACIGYAAGLSILSDGTSSMDSTPASLPQPSTSSPVKVADKSSSPSIAEQKARAEYRVLREQRHLQKISEKLEQEKKDLMELSRLEQQ